MRSKGAVKYAATKPPSGIGDLPADQIKNVQFVFLLLEQEGFFEVS